MLTNIPFVPIILGLGAVGVLLLVWSLLKNWTVVPPDKLAVFYGGGKKDDLGNKKMKFVTGGAKYKVPFFEKVEYMPLKPFKVFDETSEVFAAGDNQYIPVKLEWVALVRFSEDQDLRETAARRWLHAAENELHDAVKEVMRGQVREICSTMTVEALNTSREELNGKTAEAVHSSFRELGLQLDKFTIQKITDEAGVLDNLGAKKAADAQRDATIAKSEADRQARERSAEQRRAAAEAEAQAATKIAEAERARDVATAQYRAEVEAEQARANQAHARADAEARKAVVAAEKATEAEQERGAIDVETQRIERQKRKLQAEQIEPAEAARQAAIIEAEGRASAVEKEAEGKKKATVLQGQGDADAKTALAAATKAEMLAVADGEKAKLLAEAKGKAELAQSLNAMAEAAHTQTLVPLVVEALPKVAAELARPYGNIDKVVIIDSGSGSGHGDAMSRFAGGLPELLAKTMAVTESVTGIDLASAIQGKLHGGADGADASKLVQIFKGLDEETRQKLVSAVMSMGAEDVSDSSDEGADA